MSDAPTEAQPTRDELVEMIAKAHRGSGYAEAQAAGRALAAQSKLPKLVAENLGAGFGQWEFFPEVDAIVDFALGYAPPSTPDELWALARAWAADDAAGRPTLLTLVGRDVLQHELRRIDVPPLRELVQEIRPAKIRALRASLGLDVAPEAPPKAAKKRAAPVAPPTPPVAPPTPPAATTSAPSASPAPSPASPASSYTPGRMPKPAIRKPVKAEPAPPPRRFVHPKFGEGALRAQVGEGPDAKLTIAFAEGAKTLLARYVTEIPS